jgi:hypothetical protein
MLVALVLAALLVLPALLAALALPTLLLTRLLILVLLVELDRLAGFGFVPTTAHVALLAILTHFKSSKAADCC